MLQHSWFHLDLIQVKADLQRHRYVLHLACATAVRPPDGDMQCCRIF